MRYQSIMNISFIVALFLLSSLLPGCFFSQPTGRLSGTVLFTHSPPSMATWLQDPTKSYVQAYFMFPSDFASDIIFGIDQEFIEGVTNPIHFPGADWMALVGLNRNGLLQIPVGTSSSLNGTPSDASVWEYIDLQITLQPNTWYFMRETADFNTRRFDSFTLKGPDVNVTVDLSRFYVDYPNYIPIDNRTMTYYVYAIRLSSTAQPGSTSIYFDDVEAGIQTHKGYKPVVLNSFEQQHEIPDIPVTLPVSPLADIQEQYWYKENEDAIVSIVDTVAYSGTHAILCNATLDGLDEVTSFPSLLVSYLIKQRMHH